VKPLEGVTVLEFSTMITASFAAMMMAEQGAKVIKVEPVNVGDPMRYIGANKGGISSLFANCNRGKQSIRVNLKSEEGQSLVRELIAEVDVFIHNFRPGVMDKLNLGSDALRAIQPKLIYAAISGFGKEGPLGDAPAYDPIIQAQAGMTATQGKNQEPAFFRTLICDKITAYTACQAVTCALYVREKTGTGQHIDLSMIDSSLFFIFPDGFQNHTLLDEDHEPGPLLIDLLYDLTPTKDGAITVSAGTDEMQMRSLIAVGMEHLLVDERFNSFEKLVANLAEFKDLVADAYLQYTTEELLEKLQAADVPCARSLSKEEVLTHEQLAANDTIGLLDHPIMGNMRIIKSPARFGGERLTPARPSPDHGEHTAEVLREFNFSQEKIDIMTRQGTVA
jgi:crotonobetainyl-CoA:carnitine CoA-transferase CaiB-like acyl-CoA transferase